MSSAKRAIPICLDFFKINIALLVIHGRFLKNWWNRESKINIDMTTFSEMGLNQDLLTSIQDLGFVNPTPIQQKAIPVFLQQSNDLIALAQTGTGKTAAFGLPILHHLRPQDNYTQALVIAPTRELCIQICNDLKNFSKNSRNLRIVPVYGGSSISGQIKDLRQGAHVIVATPGRLMDMIDRKAVKLNQVETVVLDEADEMLNMGFQEDIEAILAFTPSDKKNRIV